MDGPENVGTVIESASASLTFVLSTAAVFLLVKLLVMSNNRNKNIPEDAQEVPGPIGFPVIGNIPQLGAEPHKSFAELAKRYGDVFRIKIGSRPVVVMNGRRAIQQALIRQSIDFAGRPDFFGFRTTVVINGGSVAFSTYGEGWKLHRKLADNSLRHFTSGRQSVLVEQQVTFEATELIKFVIKHGDQSAIFDPSRMLKLSVSNIIGSLLFQSRYELDHEVLKSIVNDNDHYIEAISGSNMIDFMPWLEVLLPGKRKAFTELATKFRTLLGVHVETHLENYRPGFDTDILYYLMTLSEKRDVKQKQELKLTDEQIRSSVFDFFGAGFETVGTTLIWVFLYAIYFQDWQAKVQREIDEVVGRDRLPSLSDRGKLPLTEAFLAEVSRHVSVVPTTLPHSTIRDTVLEGGFNYFIPKDTVVFVNLYSLHQDPNEWKEPGKFDPARFLSDDGTKLDVDKVDSLMRFGAGRRRCIGSEVAQMELFLYFSVIMHRCFLRNIDGQKLTLNGKGSLLVVKPPKYHVKMVLR